MFHHLLFVPIIGGAQLPLTLALPYAYPYPKP